jgi:hypothetical protein
MEKRKKMGRKFGKMDVVVDFTGGTGVARGNTGVKGIKES